MAVFDATALLHFLEPDAPAAIDPATSAPVTNAKARIDYLIHTLEQQRETIIIPTPTLSEVLVHADAVGPEYLALLNRHACFRVVAFDQRAAVELAAMTREALNAGDVRAGTQTTKAKLKFDRQIIAIAKVEGHTTIYSDDGDIAKLATALSLNVIPMHQLPMPPEDPQASLELQRKEDE